MSVLLQSQAAEPGLAGSIEEFARAAGGEYIAGGFLGQAWVVRLASGRWRLLWDRTARTGSTEVRPGLAVASVPSVLRLRAALHVDAALTGTVVRPMPPAPGTGESLAVRSTAIERLEPLLTDPSWRARLAALPVEAIEIGGDPEPVAEPLPAGEAELRLLVDPGATVDRALLRDLTGFVVELLDRLERLGLAAPAVEDRLPSRYSAPAGDLALETIRLDLLGDSCLAFDLEAVSHIDHRPEFDLLGRRRPAAAARCRTIRYADLRAVRTVKRRSWWIVVPALLISAWGINELLFQYMLRPKLTGLFVFILFGFIPLMRVVLGYRCLKIADGTQSIVFPLARHRRQGERVVAILKRACEGRSVRWDR